MKRLYKNRASDVRSCVCSLFPKVIFKFFFFFFFFLHFFNLKLASSVGQFFCFREALIIKENDILFEIISILIILLCLWVSRWNIVPLHICTEQRFTQIANRFTQSDQCLCGKCFWRTRVQSSFNDDSDQIILVLVVRTYHKVRFLTLRFTMVYNKTFLFHNFSPGFIL